MNISKTKVYEVCTGWCTEGGSSGSMQCVWKEGGFELNPLRNMWLLGTRGDYSSARKFGEIFTGFVCKMCRAGEEKQLMSFTLKMSS